MQKLIIFIPFLLLSCTPKAEKPASEVSVKIESQVLQGSDKVETRYELTAEDCHITWQTFATKKEKALEVQLRNHSECKLPFSKAAPLHEIVLARTLKDYAPSTITSMSTGGLKTLQPDGSWNLIVAKAAEQSADYQDFRKNYPNHASKKSSNGILVELIQQTQPHAPFLEMLAKLNLHFELENVEKVFQTKNEQGVTLIDDAGSFWWKPLQK